MSLVRSTTEKRGLRRSLLRSVRAGAHRSLLGLVVVVSLISGLVFDPESAHATDAVSVTASPNQVAPGSVVNLTAGIPASSQAGQSTQTITQTIDPTKVRLKSVNDIIAPTGWTISYSTDGTTFTDTAPTTTAGWNAVSAVRATGTLTSQGSTADGKQIGSTSSVVDSNQPSGLMNASSKSGDGWDVSFDNRGYVFNVYHAGGPDGNSGALDCHTLSGGTCPGSWPYGINYSSTGNTLTTPLNSSGSFDPSTNHMWVNVSSKAGYVGFVCLDLSNMLAVNKWCGGSSATAFVPLEAASLSTYPCDGSSRFFCISMPVASNGRLFAWNNSTGHLLCLVMATGTPCSSQPVALTLTGAIDKGISSTYPMIAWQGRIYGVPDYSHPGAVCFDATTLQPCPGFSLTPNALTKNGLRVMVLPDSSGTNVAACYLLAGGTAGTYQMKCYDASGSDYTPPATFVQAFGATVSSSSNIEANEPGTIGSQIFWANASSGASGKVYCWDMSLNSGAGDFCLNWNGATGIADPNYTLNVQPSNPQCIWSNGHDGQIVALNTLTGMIGCPIPPSQAMPTQVALNPALSVPRMGCNATSAISQWQQFTLTGPASYSGATLSVYDSSGAPINGWTNLALGTAPSSIDLTSLAVSQTGQTPQFLVNFAVRNGTDAVAATISASGDAPQLCLSPTAVKNCPSSALGRVDSSQFVGSTSTVLGQATTTDSGGTTVTLAPGSQSFSISAPLITDCGSQLSGTASAPFPNLVSKIPGAVVSLIDATTGLAVLDGNGNPITTTTAADGTYSFGYLTPGKYSVAFSNPPTGPVYTVVSATAQIGGPGTANGTIYNAVGSVATATPIFMAVGMDSIVNATYNIPVLATPDTTSNVMNAVQTSSVTSNDVHATGGTGYVIKLCLSTDTPPTCTGATTGTSASVFNVAGQGQYKLLTLNRVSFTPCSAANVPAGIGCTGPYIGTANPATYSVTDSSGTVASTTYTATVTPPAPPTAGADTSVGPINTAQTISPLTNDSTASGTTLNATSVRLCVTGTAAASCLGTTLTIPNEGTYVVNTTTGAVTFTPVTDFVGVATPIEYAVTNSIGQTATSTITPTVALPPNLNPDTNTGPFNTAQTIQPLTNDTAAGTATLNATTVRLCVTGTAAASCTGTSLTVANQGTYSVNTTTGLVTFTPLATFTGTATPIEYVAADSNLRQRIQWGWRCQ